MAKKLPCGHPSRMSRDSDCNFILGYHSQTRTNQIRISSNSRTLVIGRSQTWIIYCYPILAQLKWKACEILPSNDCFKINLLINYSVIIKCCRSMKSILEWNWLRFYSPSILPNYRHSMMTLFITSISLEKKLIWIFQGRIEKAHWRHLIGGYRKCLN